MPDFDLIVIGSGSGGIVGATNAAQMGKKVAVVEAGTLGGECPNFGCVPTKALLHTAELYRNLDNVEKYGLEIKYSKLDFSQVLAWKDKVVGRTGASVLAQELKDAVITLIAGKASFTSPHEIKVKNKTYSATNFLIATGSEVFIPPIEGLQEVGFITFKEALELKTLPKSLFILGGGAIGCEFAEIFSSFGTEVILADTLPRLLAREDAEVGTFLAKKFTSSGVKVLTSATVHKIVRREKEKVLYYQIDGKEHVVNANQILVATGKTPVVNLGLDKAGVKYDQHQILVNDFLQTSVPHIYAAGDVVGPLLFTHTGNYQSAVAASNMFSTEKIKVDYSVVPRCTFTSPEIACVGISEEEALRDSTSIKKATVPIGILGRANTSDQLEGFVKVIADENGKILGAAVASSAAGEMIHELALAMKLGATASQVAEMIHAYPTFSEAIKIACANLS